MFSESYLRWLILNLITVLLLSISAANYEIPGKPVHLVTIEEDSTFTVNGEVKNILLTKNISNRKVVVVSIAGAFKEGKSFLLGFFLRYLNVTYNSDPKQNNTFWLGDESQPLRGFTFKTSQDRTTTGIQMWSEPFLTTLPNGEEVAILLLDTQGLFDDSTLYSVNVKIFGLTTLISSIQMFNIMQKIQEDKLHLLKFVTDYGSIVAKNPGSNTTEPSFQKFIFLIRDWANPHETPYGFEGGQKYLNKVLKTTNFQPEELKLVRKQIKSCFQDISCFLMPYPGEKVVKNPKFTGQLSDVEEEFKNSLRELIQTVLSTENLVLKEINGETVTVSELVEFLGRYVDILNSKETLEPKSIIDANAEMSYQKALKAALEYYVIKMKSLLDDNSQTVIEARMLEKSAEYRANAIKLFNNHTKLQDPKLDESSLKELQDKIDEFHSLFREEVNHSREIFNLKNDVAIKSQEITDLAKKNREMMNNLKTAAARLDEVKKLQDRLDASQRKLDTLTNVRGEYELRIAKLESDIQKERKKGFWQKVRDFFG